MKDLSWKNVIKLTDDEKKVVEKLRKGVRKKLSVKKLKKLHKKYKKRYNPYNLIG